MNDYIALLAIKAIGNGGTLREADLRGANLRGANLRGANLREADLCGADLCGADLRGANLRGANLRGANLCKEAAWVSECCIVAEGDIVGWKKLSGGVIAKLLVPAAAKRMNAIGSRKCRAEYADVIELIGAESARDQHSESIVYAVGERVTPDSYDDDIRVDCSHGIHFFITKAEAEAY